MNNELDDIKTACEKLRSDLTAAHEAIAALASCMTPDQRTQVVKAMQQLVLVREELVAAAPTPLAPTAMQQLRESSERLQARIQASALQLAARQSA